MYLTKEKNSPYYQLVYFLHGKRKKISTKQKLKSKALEFLTDFKERIEQQQNKEIRLISLKDFESEYLRLVNSIRTNNYSKSISASFKSLTNYTGNVNLVDLNNKILENYISTIFKNSKFAAALYYRTLKAAFEKAIEWNYLKENPFKKFKLPKLPKSLPVFISYKELQLILKSTKSKMLNDLYQAAYFTGLRLSELLNLRWNAIDLKTRIITVQNSDSFTTKSKKERIIPVNESLFDILLKRYPKIIDINKTNLVFCKVPGVILNPDYVSKSFKKSVRAAKLDDKIHFHSLRHSFASNMVQKGVSLYVVKELLGHRDITTTQIYSHIRNENLFDAVNFLIPENEKTDKTKEIPEVSIALTRNSDLLRNVSFN